VELVDLLKKVLPEKSRGALSPKGEGVKNKNKNQA